MNRELIRQQLIGPGPFIIRTSDGKEFPAPHPEFVFVGRHNIVIEDEKGLLDIIDPMEVVSVRPGTRRILRRSDETPLRDLDVVSIRPGTRRKAPKAAA